MTVRYMGVNSDNDFFHGNLNKPEKACDLDVDISCSL